LKLLLRPLQEQPTSEKFGMRNKTLESQYKSLNTAYSSLSQRLSALSNSYEHLKIELDIKTSQLSDQKIDIYEIEKENKRARKKYVEVVSKYEDYKSKLKILAKKYQRLKLEYQKQHQKTQFLKRLNRLLY
jgi:chromosome segregation ATPase